MKLFKKKTLGKAENKVERTAQELQTEYNNCVAMIGDRQYKIRLNENQIEHLREEIEEINQKIDDLQKEGAKQRDKDQDKSLIASVNATLADKSVEAPQAR